MLPPWEWPWLQTWLYFTALSSIIECYLCYRPLAGRKHVGTIYPDVPWVEISTLTARQLGFSHALLIMIRIYGGMFIHDPAAYRVCHLSFVLVFFHFLWERVGARTISARNLSATEAIALITVWWMFVSTGHMGSYYPVDHNSLEHLHNQNIWTPH